MYINFFLQVQFKMTTYSLILYPLFATGVVVANLPPASLIPVVHLDLRLSPRIFEKIRNVHNAILWGWRETDSSKKPEAKNLVTLSL